MATGRVALLLFIFVTSFTLAAEQEVDLLVSAANELPMLTITRDTYNSSIIHYNGYVKNLFDWLSKRAHLKYEFVPIPENMTKILGTAGAALQYLRERKVDIVSSFLIATPERLSYMDFSHPMLYSDYGLVQPMPAFQSRLLAWLKPFQPLVWLFIILTLAVVTLLFSLYTFYVAGQGKDRVETISKNCVYAFTLLTGQGENYNSTKTPLRLVASGWCLAAIVLVNTYNGILVSYLSVPKFQPVVNSFEELANSKTIHLALQKGTIVAQYFMQAQSGVSKVLGDSLRSNPHHLTSNDREMFQLLYTGCCAFSTPRSLVDTYVYLAFTESGQCRLTGSQSVGFFQTFSFGFSKGLKYKDLINKELLYLSQTGIPDKWGRSYLKRKPQCSERLIDHPKKSRISLIDLSSAFIILAIGYSITTLVFFGELAVHCTIRRNFTIYN